MSFEFKARYLGEDYCINHKEQEHVYEITIPKGDRSNELIKYCDSCYSTLKNLVSIPNKDINISTSVIIK